MQKLKWSQQVNWKTIVTSVDIDTGEEIVLNNNYVVLNNDKKIDYECKTVRVTKHCRRIYSTNIFGID